ncbi:hypothetical protein BS47DRAFT_1338432 [Hydnum rufescens UP504]|uniref:Uncharacterized protein n=1 Tax=Hydnum rufescens UP504 TaxID=1448309 RepID=A0A9P6B8E5_9AGAM|nr:hypothetical protein BS47DRAFT_1338432 [Hydnum rufescens UP504]
MDMLNTWSDTFTLVPACYAGQSATPSHYFRLAFTDAVPSAFPQVPRDSQVVLPPRDPWLPQTPNSLIEFPRNTTSVSSLAGWDGSPVQSRPKGSNNSEISSSAFDSATHIQRESLKSQNPLPGVKSRQPPIGPGADLDCRTDHPAFPPPPQDSTSQSSMSFPEPRGLSAEDSPQRKHSPAPQSMDATSFESTQFVVLEQSFRSTSSPKSASPSTKLQPLPDQIPIASSQFRTFRAISPPCVTKPNWHLTHATFTWLSEVLAPKRRADKSRPAPSGRCQLCDALCSRPGTLQQHVVFQHRQRVARKVSMGHPFNVDLALAFTVLQIQSDRSSGGVDSECVTFQTLLRSSAADLAPDILSPVSFPLLWEKLRQFCGMDKWRGMTCRHCGLLVQRKSNLEDHRAKCDPSTPKFIRGSISPYQSR